MKGVSSCLLGDKNMQSLLSQYHTAIGRFSLNLLDEVLNEPGNALICGPSVFLTLAMTMHGAAGSTYNAMQASLGLADLEAEEIRQASLALLNLLREEKEGVELSLANSVWLSQAFELNPNFARICTDHYLAQVKMLDFTQSGAADKINHWVKEASSGKISSIIDKLAPNAALYLINAAYFQADWQFQFDQSLNRKRPFYTPGYARETVFMHSSADAGFIDSGGVKGIVLSYKDEDYFFFALLPPAVQSARKWLGELDWQDLVALLAERDYGGVELALPKFTTQVATSLIRPLAHLGMANAFSNAADFSRLSATGRGGLKISEVKHKAFCQIDEKGTEAAAATSVQMIRMSLPFKLKEVIFDRPFVYGIMQGKTGLPLFLGLMENPKA